MSVKGSDRCGRAPQYAPAPRKVKVQLAEGGGILWRPPAQLVSLQLELCGKHMTHDSRDTCDSVESVELSCTL